MFSVLHIWSFPSSQSSTYGAFPLLSPPRTQLFTFPVLHVRSFPFVQSSMHEGFHVPSRPSTRLFILSVVHLRGFSFCQLSIYEAFYFVSCPSTRLFLLSVVHLWSFSCSKSSMYGAFHVPSPPCTELFLLSSTMLRFSHCASVLGAVQQADSRSGSSLPTVRGGARGDDGRLPGRSHLSPPIQPHHQPQPGRVLRPAWRQECPRSASGQADGSTAAAELFRACRHQGGCPGRPAGACLLTPGLVGVRRLTLSTSQGFLVIAVCSVVSDCTLYGCRQ